MPKIVPIQTRGGSDSLFDFIIDLEISHHGQEKQYIHPLKDVIAKFNEYGPQINLMMSRNFPPYRNLNSIYPGLAELRTKKCRYFIYDTGENGVWIGLHGYEKKSQDIPQNEILKAKGEIIKWKENQQQSKNFMA